ncbi:MAG TPA: NAD(P)H-binding protein [Alphaproteobacteria bacterium]|jgi:nucleoside-diphosphate-sugar epimerase
MTLALSTAVIVGATGATGVHLAAELAAGGIAVRVVARRAEALARLFPQAAIEKTQADALDADALARAVAGCDLVVDCIGLPANAMRDHARTAANIVSSVKGTGARLLQVSSYWAYLPLQRVPLDEAHPRSGGNFYIQARRAAEDILEGAGAAIVHLPDFFGPHVGASSLQQPLADAAKGRAMNWIGPKTLAREYAFVPDAMRLVAALARRAEAYGQRWIFPGGGPLTGAEVAAIAGRHLGRAVKLRTAGAMLMRIASLFNRDARDFLPMVPHYLKPIRYDASKLARLLGPPQATPYDQAIPATLDWLRQRS